MIDNLESMYDHAIQEGTKGLQRLMKENRGLLHARDNHGRTLLLMAVFDANLEAVKDLVKKGACPVIYSYTAVSPFSVACTLEDSKVLDYLLSTSIHSLSDDDIAFLYATAAASRRLNNVKCLLKHGLDCNIFYREQSIVHWAVEPGNVEVIDLLYKNGASLTDSNECGSGPLYQAAAEDLIDIVEYLLSKGIDIDPLADNGCTPLSIACCFNSVRTVAALLKHGATINTKDDEGVAPLLRAIQRESFEIVEMLLQNGADTQICDNKGRGVPYYLSKLKKQSRIKMEKLLQK